MYPLLALVTPLPVMHFTTEEVTVFPNEAVKSATKAPRNPPSCFSLSLFTV